MYLPSHFAVEDTGRMHALMRAHPFGMLVSAGGEGPEISHLPVLLDTAPAPRGTLLAHFARANRHWKSLDGQPVTVVFTGPQAYVSPSHYPSKRAHGKVVPTWNYAVVHAQGTARLIHEPEPLRALVARLTDAHEAGSPAPWSLDDAPDSYVAAMLRGIVGIEIPIARLEGKWKMSQNREPADRAGVRAGLAAGSAEERAVAGMIPADDPDRGEADE